MPASTAAALLNWQSGITAGPVRFLPTLYSVVKCIKHSREPWNARVFFYKFVVKHSDNPECHSIAKASSPLCDAACLLTCRTVRHLGNAQWLAEDS